MPAYATPGLIFGPFFGNSTQLKLAVFEFFWILPWVFSGFSLSFEFFSPKAPWVSKVSLSYWICNIWLHVLLWSPSNFCKILYFQIYNQKLTTWAKRGKTLGFVKKFHHLNSTGVGGLWVFPDFAWVFSRFWLSFEFFWAWVFFKMSKKKPYSIVWIVFLPVGFILCHA